MRIIQFKTIIFIFLCSIAFNSQADNSWQLEKDEEKIKVFVASKAGSALKSFRGTMTIPARISSLVAVIEDVQTLPRWLHNCISARQLKEINQNESYNYIVTDMPWPVADRDTIVHSRLSQNKTSKEVIIKLSASQKHMPPQQGLVRIKNMSGKWQLTSVGKNRIKVVYEMSVDPGGKIPKWIVNAMVVDIPFYTLQKLRTIVKEAKYVNANLKNVTE